MSVWTRVFGKTGTKPTEGPRGASKPPSKYDPRWDPPGSEHLEGSIVDSDIVLVSSLKVWIAHGNGPKRSGEWSGGCDIPGDIPDTTLHQLVRGGAFHLQLEDGRGADVLISSEPSATRLYIRGVGSLQSAQENPVGVEAEEARTDLESLVDEVKQLSERDLHFLLSYLRQGLGPPNARLSALYHRMLLYKEEFIR
jgi:hypothetical protein